MKEVEAPAVTIENTPVVPEDRCWCCGGAIPPPRKGGRKEKVNITGCCNECVKCATTGKVLVAFTTKSHTDATTELGEKILAKANSTRTKALRERRLNADPVDNGDSKADVIEQEFDLTIAGLSARHKQREAEWLSARNDLRDTVKGLRKELRAEKRRHSETSIQVSKLLVLLQGEDTMFDTLVDRVNTLQADLVDVMADADYLHVAIARAKTERKKSAVAVQKWLTD